MHNHDNLPVVLLGAAGGTVQPGHIRRQDRPIADLFLTMLATVGAAPASFGDDSTGPLDLSV